MYKNIILYDGECGLCNRSVRFILKHERNQNLQFTSLQSSFSKKVFSDFNLKNDFDESILFYRDGKLFSKSKAVLRIVPFLKWYFYPLLIIWLIPNYIRDMFYDLIARNRKRFSKVCKLPNSNQSNRFLD
jgi:predicted DCC family thiol-disulfide oxidoreductase YuxK